MDHSAELGIETRIALAPSATTPVVRNPRRGRDPRVRRAEARRPCRAAANVDEACRIPAVRQSGRGIEAPSAP